MKTAISIPDELFERAEVLARRLGKSRSQIYREALADYVARREPAAVTEALNAVLDEADPARDEWRAEAARSTLERTEW